MSLQSNQRLSHELPTHPRPTIIFGLVIVFVTIGLFTVWAVLAPLAEAVVAAGTVKVDSSRKQIQHLEGGIVKEILVRDGDRVSKGDVLARLDETRALASVAILRDSLDGALAQEARLLAERDGLEELVFPESLTKRSESEKIQGIFKSQTVLWEARRSAMEGEVQILEKQIAQLGDDIIGFQGQIKAKSRQLSLVQDELDSMVQLQKKGLSGKKPVLDLGREAADLEGDRAELQSQLNAVETEISRKELEIFQVSKSFRQNVVDELKQVQAEINDLRERVNAAEHLYKQSEVRAPVAGVVVDSGIHTIGGVIPPGGTLLEIVPVNDKLIVEARINPKDIDKVRVGLPAGIKLTAFNARTTPELEGELRYVSADVLHDPRNDFIYFVARIEVPEEQMTRLGDKKLQPGMLAEVFIRTGERTMAEYLLQPMRDSFRRAWLED